MATMQVTFTHPGLSVTRTLTVTDAKMLEFADLLIDDYGPDENDDPLSRSGAVATFGDGVLKAAKDRYRKMKHDEDIAAIVDEEIDA